MQVNNKDTRTTSGASVVNFEHISHFIAEFEQINICWVLETIVSDSKVVHRTVRNIMGWKMGWKNMLGYVFSSLFTQNKVTKG